MGEDGRGNWLPPFSEDRLRRIRSATADLTGPRGPGTVEGCTLGDKIGTGVYATSADGIPEPFSLCATHYSLIEDVVQRGTG